ncbi:MAG: radical SAM protein [bacterium]|nr:radical SAM protein [bacterium]
MNFSSSVQNTIYSAENKLKRNHTAQKLYFRQKLRWNFPMSINLETTNHCNLRCIMCPRHLTDRGFGLMDDSLYQKLIDEIAENGGVQVLTLIKDGESLIHPRVHELIKYAKDRKAAKRIEIFSNAILLDEDRGIKLIEAGLDVLNISLDAMDSETYKKIKGRDQYDVVVKNTKRFAEIKREMGKKKPLLVAKFIGMTENGEQLEQFKTFWRGVADQVLISPYHNYGGGAKDRSLSSQKKSECRYPCMVTWFNPVVLWDGLVTTCCVNYMKNELIMGDTKVNTISEIWTNEKYQKLRSDMISGDLTDWKTCSKCTYWQGFADMNGWLGKEEKKKGNPYLVNVT